MSKMRMALSMTSESFWRPHQQCSGPDPPLPCSFFALALSRYLPSTCSVPGTVPAAQDRWGLRTAALLPSGSLGPAWRHGSNQRATEAMRGMESWERAEQEPGVVKDSSVQVRV